MFGRGRIQACPIRVEDIRHFRRALLVNAMIGLEDEVEVLILDFRLNPFGRVCQKVFYPQKLLRLLRSHLLYEQRRSWNAILL